MTTCTHCLTDCAAYREDMGISAPHTGWSLTVRLAVAFTSPGGVCIVASTLVAYLIADHLSSDSSPSSLVAVGLGASVSCQFSSVLQKRL